MPYNEHLFNTVEIDPSNKVSNLQAKKQEKIDRHAKDTLSQGSSLESGTYSDVGGYSLYNGNKAYNDMNASEIQDLIGRTIRDEQILQRDDGSYYQYKDGKETDYTPEGSLGRLYGFETKDGDGVKYGFARGDIPSSDLRYDREKSEELGFNNYGWESGEVGVDTDKPLMDVLLPRETAIALEGLIHGRGDAIANREALRRTDGSYQLDTGEVVAYDDIDKMYGGGSSEYYNSNLGVFGDSRESTTIDDIDSLMEQTENLAKSNYLESTPFKYLTEAEQQTKLDEATDRVEAYFAQKEADNMDALDKLGNAAKLGASAFVKEAIVDPADVVAEWLGGDFGDEEEKTKNVDKWLDANRVPLQKSMTKVEGHFLDAANKELPIAKRVGSVAEGIWEAATTPSMLTTSLGTLAAWFTPGRLLKAAGAGKKGFDALEEVDKKLKDGKLSWADAKKEKAKILMSVDGMKSELVKQAGFITAAMGNVNDQYDEFVENNNGQELEGLEKAEWFAKAFGVQMFNQNLDSIVALNIIKTPSLRKVVKDTIASVPQKDFSKFVVGVGKTITGAGFSMGKEAGQEYAQTMMELFNTRYGSEQFKNVDTFVEFMSDERNWKEAGTAALAGAGGGLQFEGVGVVNDLLGSSYKGLDKLRENIGNSDQNDVPVRSEDYVKDVQEKVAVYSKAPKLVETIDKEVDTEVLSSKIAEHTSLLRSMEELGEYSIADELRKELEGFKAQMPSKEVLGSDPIQRKVTINQLFEALGEQGVDTGAVEGFAKANKLSDEEKELVNKAVAQGGKIAAIKKNLNDTNKDVVNGARGYLTYYNQAKEAEYSGDLAERDKNVEALGSFVRKQQDKVTSFISAEKDVVSELESRIANVESSQGVDRDTAVAIVRDQVVVGQNDKPITKKYKYPHSNGTFAVNLGTVFERVYEGNENPIGFYSLLDKTSEEVAMMTEVYNNYVSDVLGTEYTAADTKEVSIENVDTSAELLNVLQQKPKMSSKYGNVSEVLENVGQYAKDGKTVNVYKVSLENFKDSPVLAIDYGDRVGYAKSIDTLVDRGWAKSEDVVLDEADENVLQQVDTPSANNDDVLQQVESQQNTVDFDSLTPDDVNPVEATQNRDVYQEVEAQQANIDFDSISGNQVNDNTAMDFDSAMADAFADVRADEVNTQDNFVGIEPDSVNTEPKTKYYSSLVPSDLVRQKETLSELKQIRKSLEQKPDDVALQEKASKLENTLINKGQTNFEYSHSGNYIVPKEYAYDGESVVSYLDILEVRPTGLNIGAVEIPQELRAEITSIVSSSTGSFGKTSPANGFIRNGNKINEHVALSLVAATESYLVKNAGMLTTPKEINEIAEVLGISPDDVPMDAVIMFSDGGELLKYAAEEIGSETLRNLGTSVKDLPESFEAALKAGLGAFGLTLAQNRGWIRPVFNVEGGFNPDMAELSVSNTGAKVKVVKPTTKMLEDMKTIRSKVKEFEEVFDIDTVANKTYKTAKPAKGRAIGIRNQPYTQPTHLQKDAIGVLEQVEFELNSGVKILKELFTDRDSLLKHLGWVDTNKAWKAKTPADVQIAVIGKNMAIESEVDSLLEAIEDSPEGMYFDWFVTKSGRFNLDSIGLNPQTQKQLARWLVSKKAGKESEIKKEWVDNLEVSKNPNTRTDEEKQAVMFAYAIVQAFDGSDLVSVDIDKDNEGSIIKAAKELLGKDKDELMQGALKASHVGHAASAVANIMEYQSSDVFVSDVMVEFDGLTNGFSFKTMQHPVMNYDEMLEWWKKIGISTDDSLNSMNGVRDKGDFTDVYVSTGITASDDNKLKEILEDKFVDVKKARSSELQSALDKIGLTAKLEGSTLRNLLKSPVMVFVYSAGIASIKKAIVKEKVKEFLEKIDGISSRELDSVLGISGVKEKLVKNSIYSPSNANIRAVLEKHFNLVYAEPVAASLKTTFEPFIALNNDINNAFTLAYEVFSSHYKANNPELKTKGQKRKFIKDFLSMAPMIKGPDSDKLTDQILIMSRSLEKLDVEVLGDLFKQANIVVPKSDGGMFTGTVQLVMRGLGAPGAAGNVLPIQTMDGSTMGRTLLDSKGGFLGVHDALVLGVSQFDSVKDYNANWWDVNDDVDLVANTIDMLDRVKTEALVNGVAVDSIFVMNGNIPINIDSIKFSLSSSRSKISNNRDRLDREGGLKVGQMVGPEGTMASRDIVRRDERNYDRMLKENENKRIQLVKAVQFTDEEFNSLSDPAKKLVKNIHKILKKNGCK
jgi:hypothetical protein